MKVEVMSRAQMTQYCKQPHSETALWISITDPYSLYEDDLSWGGENGIKYCCPLAFVDADHVIDESSGVPASIRKHLNEGLMCDEDALMIVIAIRSCVLDVDKIIVQCDAGRSRSAGVAAAIKKYFDGDDTQFFDDPYYRPNMLCYRKTLEMLQRMCG